MPSSLHDAIELIRTKRMSSSIVLGNHIHDENEAHDWQVYATKAALAHPDPDYGGEGLRLIFLTRARKPDIPFILGMSTAGAAIVADLEARWRKENNMVADNELVREGILHEVEKLAFSSAAPATYGHWNVNRWLAETNKRIVLAYDANTEAALQELVAFIVHGIAAVFRDDAEALGKAKRIIYEKDKTLTTAQFAELADRLSMHAGRAKQVLARSKQGPGPR
jgi:hypothetical protein